MLLRFFAHPLVVGVVLASVFSSPIRAQNLQGLDGLFGGIVGAAIEDQNRSAWRAVPREEFACTRLGLRKTGTDLSQIIREGIPPNDPMVDSIRSTCRSVISRKLRRNVDCTINTDAGAFSSKCDEDFASGDDSKTRISQADALEQAFTERGVATSLFERRDAQSRREQMISSGTTSGTVVGPNFDCAKAQTDTETAICNSAALSALDTEFGSLYRRYDAIGHSSPVNKQVKIFQKQRDDCTSEDCIRTNIVASIEYIARVLRRRGDKVETSIERAQKLAALEAAKIAAQKQAEQRQAQVAEEQAAEAVRRTEAEHRAEAERIEAERIAIEQRAKADADRKVHLAKVTSETNDLVKLASDFLKSDKSNPRLLTIAEAIASATSSVDAQDPDKIEQAKAALDRAVRDDPTFTPYQQAEARAQAQENARLLSDAHAEARKQARFLKSYIAENPTSAAAKGAIGFVKKADELSASTDLRQLRGYIGSVQDLLREYDLQQNFLLSLNAVDDKAHDDGSPSNEVGLGRTAKNEFIIDGPRDDLVLMYVAAPSAPNVLQNLRGEIVFDHSKAVVCLYQRNGSDEIRDRVTSALAKYQIESLLIDAQPCAPSTLLNDDVVAVERGEFLKQDVAYASALIKEIETDHIKPLVSISADQIATKLQSIETKRKHVEEDIEHGTLDGFGLLIMPAYASGRICGAIKDDVDAHEAILDRFADPIVGRLRQRIDLRSASFEDVFKDVQRSRCSAVYASAADLKLLLTALRRGQVTYQVFEETISTDQLKNEQQRIKTADAADEKAALDRRRQEDEARKLRTMRDNDVASTRQAQQAALREKFAKLAISSAADISNELKAYFKSEYPLKSDQLGADVPLEYPAIAEWYQNALRDHWHLQSIDSGLDDFGDVDWKGRTIEAAVAVIHVRLKNAIIGEYRDGCFKAGHVVDNEFKVTRDSVGVPCDDSALSTWKTAHSFHSVWNLN